jgi:hypothetical protein
MPPRLVSEMKRAGDHPVASGPLAVRWLAYELPALRAGAIGLARIAVENAGSAVWRSQAHSGIYLSYHWLDGRGNAIVWDGLRTYFARPIAPGEVVELEVEIRGPLPPGEYRLALDLVDEGRYWFAELGGTTLDLTVPVAPRIRRALGVRIARADDEAGQALAAQEEPTVPEPEADAVAYLTAGCLPAPDWSRRLLDAHQEGFGIVAGSVEPVVAGLRGRRGAAAALRPWAPGTGRIPHFSSPLLCPSIVKGVEPRWIDDVEGLPALQPPADRLFGEPWLYDGRIAIRARLRSGRRRG